MMENRTLNLYFRPVTSSQIKEVAYDQKSETLYIRFKKNDKTYSYTPISKKTHQEMMKSDSVGKYFHKHIKSKING